MNQSAFIAAAILGAFVLFVAARGRLKSYADVLFGPAPSLGPFAGIPIAGGPANQNQPQGGGGGGGLPAAASGGGEAAANSNWLGEAEQIVAKVAPYAELAVAG